MTEQNNPSDLPNIAIKAEARQNALSLMVFGCVGLLVAALAANFWWDELRLQIVFGFLASFVTMVLGLFKHYEPLNSFELTPEGIRWNHRHGTWLVDWDNIMMIEQPRVTVGTESKSLNYIALKLKDSESLTRSLPRRFANQLLGEQRDLYFLACQVENISLFDRQINDSPYKMATGEKVIGPVGAFMHRTAMMRQIFGFDLYVPLNACDREPDEFVALLKQCKEAAGDYRSDAEIKDTGP